MGKLLEIQKSPEERALIVNEFYDVDKLCDEHAPIEKRRKQLRTEICSWCPDPLTEYSEKTDRVHLLISACAPERTVNTRAAYKILGLKEFLLRCKVTMTALADKLTKPVIESLLDTAQTGARTLNATPIVAAPETKAGS